MELADVLAGISIAFTAFVYFYHGAKLNSQQKLLNEMQKKKFEQEEAESRKANISANPIKVDNSVEVVISNKGQSIARNIRIEVIEIEDYVVLLTKKFPYPLLNPGDSFKIPMNAPYTDSKSPIVKFIWDDSYAINREKTQLIDCL